ncbi:MAG: hypothetical protein KGH75_01145 [Rhodospirillales bacterium]|nr:hypothetical protein [Rhodospirillales bacterium]
MTERRRDTKAILQTIARSELRSPLFHWMVKHHDELMEESARERIDWKNFCAEVARQGITDTQGQPPTIAMARKTWGRVRKAVAERRAAAKPPRPTPPSRFPKDWTPPLISETPIPVPAYLRAPGTTTTSPAPSLPAPPVRTEAGAIVDRGAPEPGSMEDLLQSFDKADWHLLGGKRRPPRPDSSTE